MARMRTGVWFETSVLTIAVFLVLALWSLTTPLYSTVDETRHANSVVRLMEGGGWPAPKTAPILEATELGAREAGRPVTGAKVPGAPEAEGTPAPAPDGPVPADERSSLAGVEGPPSGVVPHLDWMTQHPPGYYAALALPLKAVGADDWRWDHLLLAMRLMSCLFTALAVPFVAGAARVFTRSRAAGLAGGGLILLVPQWFNTSSLVTNDSLLTLLGAVLLYAGVRATVRPETLVSSSALGALALGGGLLTKGLMLTAIPVLAVFLLVAGWRAGRTWRQRFWIPLGAGVLAFVIGGWWWVRNILVFGTLQPSNFGSGRDPVADPAYSMGSYLDKGTRRLMQTFWGSVRESLTFPQGILLTATVLAALVVVAAFVLSKQRLVLLLTFLYPAFVTGLTFHHSWEIYWNHGRIQGIQGRYLFGGIIALALCVATVWEASLRRRAVGRVAGTVLALAVVVVPVAAWLFSARRLWDGDLGAMVDAGPAGTAVYVLVAAGAVAALVVTAATIVSRFVVETRPTDPEPEPLAPTEPAPA